MTKPIKREELKRIFGEFADELPSWENFLNRETIFNADFAPHNNAYLNSYKNFSTRYAKAIKNADYDGILAKHINNKEYLVVFDSNQIKAVSNKGTFDATNPNIYHSNAHIGAGLLGGGIAGTERDENGDIIAFNPQNFALESLQSKLLST